MKPTLTILLNVLLALPGASHAAEPVPVIDVTDLEWNVALDPQAIVCLLRSDLPIALYPDAANNAGAGVALLDDDGRGPARCGTAYLLAVPEVRTKPAWGESAIQSVAGPAPDGR